MLNKKLVVAVLAGLGAFGLSSLAYADTNSMGPYVGAQLGWAQVDYGNLAAQLGSGPGISNSNDDDGIAGGILAGWQFNPYFALESSYNWFDHNDYKSSFNDGQGDVGSAESTVRTTALNFLAKGILPISVFTGCPNPLSLYAKAGVAYVDGDADANASYNGPNVGSFSFSQPTTVLGHEWVPVAGAGVSYNITNNVLANLDYLHYFGHDTSPSDTSFEAPKIDYVTLGMTYRFDLA